jgi:DNA-binding NtrC family response regulator
MSKILVIDDEQGIRDLLDTLLSRKGYDVVLAVDPKQPVIILTGASTADAEQKVRALGVTEFVEKEFSLHELGGSLKRLLPTRRHAMHRNV